MHGFAFVGLAMPLFCPAVLVLGVCLAAIQCAEGDAVNTIESCLVRSIWFHVAFALRSCIVPSCTSGVVGGVVILPSMSQVVYHHHDRCLRMEDSGPVG
jgi:hypothetical protein